MLYGKTERPAALCDAILLQLCNAQVTGGCDQRGRQINGNSAQCTWFVFRACTYAVCLPLPTTVVLRYSAASASATCYF